MFKTAAAAEQAFYEAFARQDAEAMMRVWADDRSVFCVHPGGRLLSGREAVAESWLQIFQAEVPFQFQLERHYCEEFAEQFVLTHLTETLYLDRRVVGAVLATNSYCATAGGWRMIMHHASPKPDPGEVETAAPVLH